MILRMMFENWQAVVMGRPTKHWIKKGMYPAYDAIIKIARKGYSSDSILGQVMAPWSYQLELVAREQYIKGQYGIEAWKEYLEDFYGQED